MFLKSRIMDKILSLEIFGRFLFESDAEAWLKLCKEQKKEWILTHTEQKDESLINEFINNPNISKDCKCLDCGKTKKNESSGISEKITATPKSVKASGNSKSNSHKGQSGAKEGKA